MEELNYFETQGQENDWRLRGCASEHHTNDQGGRQDFMEVLGSRVFSCLPGVLGRANNSHILRSEAQHQQGSDVGTDWQSRLTLKCRQWFVSELQWWSSAPRKTVQSNMLWLYLLDVCDLWGKGDNAFLHSFMLHGRKHLLKVCLCSTCYSRNARNVNSDLHVFRVGDDLVVTSAALKVCKLCWKNKVYQNL